MKENKEQNPNTLCPWSLQRWLGVTASLKGTHAGVQIRKPTLQDCPLGTGQRQLKSNEIPRALARTVGEVTEPQGQETLQTRMERTLGKLWSMGQGLSFTKPVCTHVTLKGSTQLLTAMREAGKNQRGVGETSKGQR